MNRCVLSIQRVVKKVSQFFTRSVLFICIVLHTIRYCICIFGYFCVRVYWFGHSLVHEHTLTIPVDGVCCENQPATTRDFEKGCGGT